VELNHGHSAALTPTIAPQTLQNARGVTVPYASTSPTHRSRLPTISIKVRLRQNSFTQPFKAKKGDEGIYRISYLTSKRKGRPITQKRCQVIYCKVNWVAN